MRTALPVHFKGHKGAVYALAQVADRPAFLSGSGDDLVVEWIVDRPDEGITAANAGQAVYSLHLALDKNLLFIGDEHGGLHVIDLEQRCEVQLEQIHRKGIFSVVPLPHDRLACAGGDGVLSIWQLSGKSIGLARKIPLCEEKLRDLAVSPDSTSLAVACGDGSVRLLDTTDLNEHHTLAAHAEGTTSVAWHPRKPVLISGGKDGQLRLWRSDRDFAALLSLPAHGGAIYGIVFNTDGTRCATASRDKTAKVWDAATFDALARLDRAAGGHTHSVNAVRWIGDVLVTAGDDKQVIAWSMA